MVAGWAGALAGAAAIGAAMLAGALAGAFRSRLVETEIELDALPRPLGGYRILLVTDIHRRTLPARKLSRVRGTVDVVLVGGDMTERDSPLRRLDDNMALLASIAPVYAVHGNHDRKAGIEAVDGILGKNGVRVLINENVRLEREGEALWLTGVDYPGCGGTFACSPLPDMPAEAATACRIILVHDPLWLAKRKSVPADLILAGHTHGGQIVLPFIGRKHVEAFYNTYSAGMFTWPRGDGTGGDAKLFISRGFGTVHLPLRWRSPAELNLLTLRCPGRKGKSAGNG